MEAKEQKAEGRRPGLLEWLICVAGWLACAGLCLWASIELEAYPAAYDLFSPAILLMLFCNLLLFLFIAVRWASSFSRLCGSVVRLCVGEALILAIMYGAGRYWHYLG